MHFGFDDLRPKADHFAFTVLRDPVNRCFSMYRQEVAVNRIRLKREESWHHYRALPRYGAFWNYKHDRNFHAWLENVPRWLLLRQLTTFDISERVGVAASRISSLDYVFTRDFAMGSQEELFGKLGLDPTALAVSTDRNRSDPRIPVPAEAESLFRDLLEPEYELLASLMT
jgi:hypothetical protein